VTKAAAASDKVFQRPTRFDVTCPCAQKSEALRRPLEICTPRPYRSDMITILSAPRLTQVQGRRGYEHQMIARTHLSLDKDCPQPRRIQSASAGDIIAWVVCIIATNAARHDRRNRFGVKDRCIFRPLCSDATEPRISIRFAPVADLPD